MSASESSSALPTDNMRPDGRERGGGDGESRVRESNPRHRNYKFRALPTELTRRFRHDTWMSYQSRKYLPHQIPLCCPLRVGVSRRCIPRTELLFEGPCMQRLAEARWCRGLVRSGSRHT